MQRKGVDPIKVAEEGKSGVQYSSSHVDNGSETRKRHASVPSHQGWNPITVLLVAALFTLTGIVFYLNSQDALHRSTIARMIAESHEKQTHSAKTVGTMKHRIDESEKAKNRAEDRDRAHLAQVQEMQEEITNLKHSLHEEHQKSLRIHRDNVELHKKLKVKSEELLVLEDQTSQFEAEMSHLTKAIHKVQGEVQEDMQDGNDYEILYKQQGEQRERLLSKRKLARASAGAESAAKSAGRKIPAAKKSATASGNVLPHREAIRASQLKEKLKLKEARLSQAKADIKGQEAGATAASTGAAEAVVVSEKE